MRTSHLLTVAGILAGSVTATASTATADAIIPIAPDQAFHGLVNGVHDNAEIRVICPGPATPGQTGHPASGQTLAVAQGWTSTKGGGYTGSAGTSVVAGFGAASSSPLFKFSYYNVPQDIPTTISLPCSGTGVLQFTPEPTTSTAQTDSVPVTFVNIAV